MKGAARRDGCGPSLYGWQIPASRSARSASAASNSRPPVAVIVTRSPVRIAALTIDTMLATSTIGPSSTDRVTRESNGAATWRMRRAARGWSP